MQMYRLFFVLYIKKICKFVFIMETCTTKEYIQSKDTLDGKIGAIEALIDAMLANAIDIVEDSGTMSYSMDDGQMKVSTQYRSMKEVTKAILSLEQLKNLYVNRRNGHRTILRGKLNL